MEMAIHLQHTQQHVINKLTLQWNETVFLYFLQSLREGRIGAGVSPVRHTSKMLSPASWLQATQSHDRLSEPGSCAVVASISSGSQARFWHLSSECRQRLWSGSIWGGCGRFVFFFFFFFFFWQVENCIVLFSYKHHTADEFNTACRASDSKIRAWKKFKPKSHVRISVEKCITIS